RDELPIAHTLDALLTSQQLVEQHMSQTGDPLILDPTHIADTYFSEAETAELRLLRVKAVQHAAGLAGPPTQEATTLDMLTATAYLEKDAADSRDHIRQTRAHHRHANPVLLRRMARESRRDALDYTATNILPHLPRTQAIALADTWHRTLAYLTRHNPPPTSNTTTPDPTDTTTTPDPTAASIPATDTTVSTSIPATTPNAYADLLARAREAAEAQSTHRLDYHAIATTLFGPEPTSTHIALATHLAPPALKVTPEAAKATARLITTLMGDNEPHLPHNPTLTQKIDYAIWSAAHTITNEHKNNKLSVIAIARSIWGDKQHNRQQDWLSGWLMATGLTGALPSQWKDFNHFKPLADKMHGSTKEFKVPNFAQLARKFPVKRGFEEPGDEAQGTVDASTSVGAIYSGLYTGWGLDDSLLPRDGVRYRLARAAREERERSGSSDPATIAAGLLGMEQPGIDQVVLVQELLRADLNLQDPQFPGLAQIIVQAVGHRRPPAIPGPRSTRKAKEAWERLSEPQKLARRIDLAIYSAADSIVRTGRYRPSGLIRSIYPEPNAHKNQRNWMSLLGWLEAFGLEAYHPARPGHRELVRFMEGFFDEIWEAVDAGEDLSGLGGFAGQAVQSRETRRWAGTAWLQALGLIGAPITGGSVRGRVLQRVKELVDQGVDDAAEMAQKAFGTRRVFPSQVVVARQMMRLLDRGPVSTYLPVLAKRLVSYHGAPVMVPPGVGTTLQQRIDYAIWRAATDIEAGRKIALGRLVELVFNGAPHTSVHPPMVWHATSPIGRTARRYFLLGVLAAAGLRPAYRLGSSVARNMATIVGEFQLQKSVNGAGASPHSTTVEIFSHEHAPHTYQSFIWGLLETLGLRGTSLPPGGLRARMHQTVDHMLDQHPDATTQQTGELLFGTGELNPEALTATSLWMKTATPRPLPAPQPTTSTAISTDGGITSPGVNASLPRQTGYVVAATLRARSQPGYTGDDIPALVKELFGIATDPFGLALVTGILEGAALTGLNNHHDPDQAHTLPGAALTLTQARALHDDATLQKSTHGRIVISHTINGVIPHRQHHHHARTRGLLAGRGLLPTPRPDTPLHRLQQNIINHARTIEDTYGTLTPDDIDHIAYTILHVTTTPDEHQHHVIKELLHPHGIHITETRNPTTGPSTPHTHPDNDHPDSPHHSDSDSDSDSDKGDNPHPMDLDPQNTTHNQQAPPDTPGSSSIHDVLEGRTTSRTITAEDLAAVALPDLDTLRRQTPEEPDYTQGYDPAKAADYAMALALAPTTLTTPIHPKEFLEQLTAKLQVDRRTLISYSLLFGSGGRIKIPAGNKWVNASIMKRTLDLFWQGKRAGETYTATTVARLLIGDGPGDPGSVGHAVRGYWMAAGLGDYGIATNGARDVVRKAVYELACVFTVAGDQPDPRLIAQRIYAAGEEPLESQVLIVEEFLRQHAENSAPLTAISDTAAPTDLDTIPLDDLEKLRDAVPDLPAEPFSDPRLAADYGTALALAHSRSEATLDHAPHNKYLTQGSDKYFHTAAGLLFAGGAKLKFNRESEKHLNSKFLRQSIDIAYQQQSNNRPHTPASAAKAMGSNGAAIYVRGFWMAAGLGEYAITEGGARDVVRKAVRKLADVFTSAGKEPDASLIALRVYSPGRRPEVQHVVMVEEFLRQNRAMEEAGGAASEGGLDTVRLDDLDRLRGSMPEPPSGEEYDQELVADYAAHLALAQSPDAPRIDPSAYAERFAPPRVTDGRNRIDVSRALLFASGAQAAPGTNNSLVTVDKMRQGFALAGQVDDRGEPLTMTQAASKMGSKSAKYVVRGFWLAAGLRGEGLRRGGARDVIRKAVDTLAGALTAAGGEPDAWLIAQRIYAPGREPREQQVVLVEELLRQRKEAAERAETLLPPMPLLPAVVDGLGGVRVGVRVEHVGAGRLRAVLQVRGGGKVEVLPGG
ncbi:hypothetical protein ACFUJR_38525, partial [Streptomyces sp. NPDC057271]|uniref:hypothetical protein n=1 Tax=Streptomyces sp. NPDC057271 TaxID=3346078 RepID=UPI00362E992B